MLRGLKRFNAAFDSSPIRHQGTSLGLAKCFYWISKLLRGTFWHPLKASKAQNHPQKLVRHRLWLHLCLLSHPNTLLLGPANCFYWASKLLRGTFSASLKASKAQNPPQQRRTKAAPTPQPPQTVSIGSRNRSLCGIGCGSTHVFGTFKSFKSPKPSAAAFEGSSIRQHGTPLGPTNCFY